MNTQPWPPTASDALRARAANLAQSAQDALRDAASALARHATLTTMANDHQAASRAYSDAAALIDLNAPNVGPEWWCPGRKFAWTPPPGTNRETADGHCLLRSAHDPHRFEPYNAQMDPPIIWHCDGTPLG